MYTDWVPVETIFTSAQLHGATKVAVKLWNTAFDSVLLPDIRTPNNNRELSYTSSSLTYSAIIGDVAMVPHRGYNGMNGTRRTKGEWVKRNERNERTYTAIEPPSSVAWAARNRIS